MLYILSAHAVGNYQQTMRRERGLFGEGGIRGGGLERERFEREGGKGILV
jgi:hypothetical protein